MAKFFVAETGSEVVIPQVLVGRNGAAHKLFADLTVNEVAKKYNLDSNDVEVVINSENQDLVSLSIRIKKTEYLIPFSTGMMQVFYNEELNLKMLRQCRFVISAAAKRYSRDDPSGNGRYSQGDVMYDGNGNEITEPYMSLGKPARPISTISAGVVSSATAAAPAQLENEMAENE